MKLVRVLLALSLGAIAATAAAPAKKIHAVPTYALVAQIPVGGDGFWDYLTLDETGSRLYVSHGTNFAVLDPKAGSVAGAIADTPGAHGMAIAPEVGRGFTTNGRENKVSVVDLRTLRTVAKIDVPEGPDAILYAAATGRIYVFCGDANVAAVVDPKTAKVVATVPLGGAPEFGVEDRAAGVVYNNLEDTSEIVAIDEKTAKVTARWSLAPGEEPTGLAIDVAHHRLFAGCHNGKEIAVDARTGKVVATWPIGRGVDACRYDAELGLVFASCGDGTVTIAHEDAPDRYTVVQTLETAPGARTMELDPKTHRIYLSAAKLEPAPEPAPGQRRARPAVVSGTFKVLVYGPK